MAEHVDELLRAALLAAACVLAVLWFGQVLAPDTAVSFWARTMRGMVGPNDLVQDLIGARALLEDANAYPLISQATVEQFGLPWDVDGRSTHPPTAFLFVFPLAGLPWSAASAMWAVLTAAVFGVSVRLFRLGWVASAVGIIVFAVWPASAASSGQFSALWLLCALLAWRWRDRPSRAGAVIAVAALTKLFPALLLLLFIRRRQWSAVWSFVIIWSGALAVVVVLSPDALFEYASIIVGGADEQTARTDNGALLIAGRHLLGAPGVLAGAGIIAAVGIAAWRSNDRRTEWLALHWLSVALMPVGWIYSVCVLAPIPVALLRSPAPYLAVPPILAGLGLFVVEPFHTEATAAGVALFVAATGVGVVTVALTARTNTDTEQPSWSANQFADAN